MNIEFKRTDYHHPDFPELVVKLDAYLKITDGDEHGIYNQFNGIDVLNYVVIAFDNNKAVGCGALKKYDENTLEIKRMFVDENSRNMGIAQQIVSELERWTLTLGFKNTILETGKRQREAVSFYKKCNYQQIPNYGPYQQMQNSVCFFKKLTNEI